MSSEKDPWKDFDDFKPSEENIAMSALYASMVTKFKKKGSNLTPPKKKRKKK